MAKKKWLSVLLAVMFVLSIIPTAIFATGATEIVIEDADDLAAAIAGQQADQTWIMKENTYVLTQEHLNQYASWNDPVRTSGISRSMKTGSRLSARATLSLPAM